MLATILLASVLAAPTANWHIDTQDRETAEVRHFSTNHNVDDNPVILIGMQCSVHVDTYAGEGTDYAVVTLTCVSPNRHMLQLGTTSLNPVHVVLAVDGRIIKLSVDAPQ